MDMQISAFDPQLSNNLGIMTEIFVLDIKAMSCNQVTDHYEIKHPSANFTLGVKLPEHVHPCAKLG
jgi:hypothetical protein